MPKKSTKSTQSIGGQIMRLPKQVHNVCMTTLSSRYDRHYHPKNSHHKKHLIADIILASMVLFLLGFSAYIILFYQQKILHQKIEFILTPSERIVQSGGELEFAVLVKNNTDQLLYDTYFEFPIGTEFVVSEVDGKPLEKNQVFIGALDKNEQASVDVKGYVISSIDQTFRLNAIFKFKSSPLLANSEILISESLAVSGSSLVLDFDIPETIVANQPFDFVMSYSNTSGVTHFRQISILPDWPPGWEIINTEPSLDEGVDYWKIDSIGSQEQGKITGNARLLTTDLETAEISIKVFSAPFGTPLLQQELALDVPVRYPNVHAEVVAKTKSVALGSKLDYIITIQNNEKFAVEDIKARIDINQALFAAESYQNLLNDEDLVEFSVADTLSASDNIQKEISFNLRSQVNPKLAFGNNDVIISLPVEILYVGENQQFVTLTVQPALTNLKSDLTMQAFSRYYSAEGDQIGRGPLPPVVGETTKYWVFIHLNNQLHKMRDVEVRALLPLGVEWTGKVSVTGGGSLSYNEGSRQIYWPVGNLPDYKTMFDKSGFGVAFEVAVTPRADQQDRTLKLVNDIAAQGVDQVTGEIINTQVLSVSNNMERDTYASQDSAVKL